MQELLHAWLRTNRTTSKYVPRYAYSMHHAGRPGDGTNGLVHCSLITITDPPNSRQPLYSGRCYRKIGSHYFMERTGTEQFRRIRLSQSLTLHLGSSILSQLRVEEMSVHVSKTPLQLCLFQKLLESSESQSFISSSSKHLSRCVLITDCLKSRDWGFCPEQTAVA